MCDTPALTQCLTAVETLINEIADNMDPAKLLEHLDRGPWVYLHMNAVRTAEQWMHASKSGRRVEIMVPLPHSPKTWPNRKLMRQAVCRVIEAEQWPIDVKLDLAVPLDLTGPEGFRGE